MRRWCDGGGMVLTRMLYGGEKVFMLPLTRRVDYRLPKGREQMTGKLDRGSALDRDANLGALLRLRRHFPKAALKLTDDQWMYLSEMYDGGMSVTEIAAVHDVNKSTVSRSVNRAKKTLQDYLQFCL